MKTKYYILGTLALLCLLGTGYYARTLYEAYRKQVAEWNEEAKACFEEALWLEVNKRAEIPMLSYSSGEEGMATLRDRIPDTVSVMTMEGGRKYKIEREKYDNSLIKETRKRANLSFLLEKYPLSVDTLGMYWSNLLSEKEIPLGNRIRYIYTDLDLENDTVYSYEIKNMDSLTVTYLGFRCEHELVAYTESPSWLLFLSSVEWVWLLFPWVAFGLIVASYAKLETFFRRKFIKEKIVKTKIHVADVKIDKAKIFLLPDGSLFDSFDGTLTKGEISKQLPPQSALLLKLFLRKENHHLSPVEIEQELWNGNGSTDQLRQAIQRLRRELKTISSEVVIKNVNGDYELKSPISSNNSAETDS